jgi:hypothetical protein
MCDNNDIAAIESTEHGYNCQTRPYMTALLVVSILVFIVLRKSTFIKVNYQTSLNDREIILTRLKFTEMGCFSSPTRRTS